MKPFLDHLEPLVDTLRPSMRCLFDDGVEIVRYDDILCRINDNWPLRTWLYVWWSDIPCSDTVPFDANFQACTSSWGTALYSETSPSSVEAQLTANPDYTGQYIGAFYTDANGRVKRFHQSGSRTMFLGDEPAARIGA